jgi:L-ornithine Nalpha-acyltransferase
MRKTSRGRGTLNHIQSINATRGELALRLAESADDISACQRLRGQVFYEDRNADPPDGSLDRDRFDAICDHLMVERQDGELVGTYRLLRQEVAEANGGFYTENEFDIAPLIARHPDLRFLELGRSCVLKPFRTRPVVELLWQGIWNYVRAHDLHVMIGCASFEGVDPHEHRQALGFLARHATAPEEWRVKALPHRMIGMALPAGNQIDDKEALRGLPPLIKGYLRLGCYAGEGAVIDEEFGSVDVMIVLPVSAIEPRYFAHFGPPNG